jgi:hypothetical protein
LAPEFLLGPRLSEPLGIDWALSVCGLEVWRARA